jgi:drug/metabolite transporter (DMT)-like permease
MTWTSWFQQENRWLGFAALALVIVGNSLGNVLLKMGAMQGVMPHGPLLGFLPWQTFAGIFCFGFGIVAYAWALKQFDLHSAQIVVSLQYVCVIMLSYVVMGERIAPNEWIGIALIGLGLLICSR